MISLSSNTVCYTNILNKRVQAEWLPWRSESAKKCVTTYLLNQLDLKMEGQKKGESRTTVEMQETREALSPSDIYPSFLHRLDFL